MKHFEQRRQPSIPAEGQQLELFSNSSDWIKETAAVKSVEHASAVLAEPSIAQTVQFDLFVHSPLDQALNGLRLAILRGSVEFAEQFYGSAKAIDAKNSAGAEPPHPSQALADAGICTQFLLNAGSPICARSEWHWLSQNTPVLQRFIGAAVNPLIEMRLKMLAMDPVMDEFIASEPDAYAAQIWIALNEPALAKAALARDAGSSRCPQRLQLWALVSAAPELTFHDAAKLESLGYWLALCFDWPEHAESTLPLNPRFAARWAQFCDLDCADDITNFPGFSSLYGIPWPAPDALDIRPGALLLRACQGLNSARDSAPMRLALKALAPEIFQYWMKKR